MENNDFQNIWKTISPEIQFKSKEELNHMLAYKTRKVLNRYIYHFITSAVICLGFLVFLIVTMVNRWDDPLYRLNNLLLCAIILVGLISSIWSIVALGNNKLNLPLKEWLKYKIDILTKWIYNKTAYFLIPILFVMTNLSIHVYYENKLFIDVVKTDESVIGLLMGFIIGLAVSYFVVVKIRRGHRFNLEKLKSLYNQIDD
jgi:hypothetical protein